ncbi:MAG: hypothetical protein JXM70_29725 [Pirellulales bacterium]|nr:hypothetical protein [Pirellulales bacterium]
MNFRTLTVILILGIAFTMNATLADESILPSVSNLLNAQWKRVKGPASGGSVLDVGPAGSWYESYVGMPTVNFDGKTYRMWFVGGQETNDPGVPYGAYERIGLATSSDGLNWQVANGGQPVLDLGPAGSYDNKGLSHPFVLRVGETFMMWYAAIDGTTAGSLGLSPTHVRVERVCLATSTDGIQWTRTNGGNPVMDIGPPGSIDSIQTDGMAIVQSEENFKMVYGAYNGKHSIGAATSPDGINWTKSNGGQSVTGLSGSQQLGPALYFDGTTHFMPYGRLLPTNNGGSLWATYAATSQNMTSWTPAYNDTSLLSLPGPESNFDSCDGIRGNNHSVHPTKIIYQDGRAQMWYMAQSSVDPTVQRIGLMEAHIKGFPSKCPSH